MIVCMILRIIKINIINVEKKYDKYNIVIFAISAENLCVFETAHETKSSAQLRKKQSQHE